jgi:putative flavoprotein involved in K+ transport
VENVISSTGYHPGFSWIDLPAFEAGEPMHERGIVGDEPGLYFVRLEFLYAMSSVMVHGVARDADHIASRVPAQSAAP